MNNEIIQALEKIKNLPAGESILKNPRLFKSVLDDLMPGTGREMFSLRKRIVEAVELGIYERLTKASVNQDIDRERLVLIDMLCNDGINKNVADNIVSAFTALFTKETFDDDNDDTVTVGELSGIDDDGEEWTYIGDIVNNQRHGKGKITWLDGSWYEGDWGNNKKNGKGVELTNLDDGSSVIYEGDFYNNKWHGKGKRVFSDDTEYKGVFANDEFVSEL